MSLPPITQRPIMYLSGLLTVYDTKQMDAWYKKTGCKHRCYSFAYACPGAFYFRKIIPAEMQILVANGGTMMMDSSGFSFYRFSISHSGEISSGKKRHFSSVDDLRETTIKQYMKYCKEHGDEWDFYVNFDYVRECDKIWAMQKRMERAGLHPTPIYHGDSSIDWFRRYLDLGHDRIGISRCAAHFNQLVFRRYLDRVFNEAEKAKQRVKLHGFALTAPTVMLGYPWFSVDTANWVRLAALGCVYTLDKTMHTASVMSVSDRENVRPGHSRSAKTQYSRLPKKLQDEVREEIEGAGFNFKKIQSNLPERLTYNGWYIVTLFDRLKATKTGREYKPLRWGSLL